MKPGRYRMAPCFEPPPGSTVIPPEVLIRDVIVFADMNVDGFVMTEETTDGPLVVGKKLWFKGNRSLRALNLYTWVPVMPDGERSADGARFSA